MITLGRRPLVAGNWKLHNTIEEARALASTITRGMSEANRVEVVVAPPFTALAAVRDVLAGSPVALAAQDVHWEDRGAFTGAVGAPLLRDVGCRYVIVGHSERRGHFGESDDDVRRKALAALRHAMSPILCVGESLEQRQRDETLTLVRRQVEAALEGLDDEAVSRVVIAYEPIWAIGTGRTALPADAQVVHAAVRRAVADGWGAPVADGLRILYGGSVKPDNARALMAEPDVDGALVGGASLDAAAFCAIVSAAN